MISFLHVADIHLDSPLRGLSRYEGAPVEEMRGATRQALTNLVDYVLENAIPLVVLAGDVYDADCPDFQTLLHFARQMSRLGDRGVQVAMIRGNHDADNAMTSALRLPGNVAVLPSSKPGTWRSEALPVAVHGQSYAGREISDNLALDYPAPIPGLFNIGLLHTALTGRVDHAPYAPCSLTDLAAKGYDYWALGHVHEFEHVSQAPHVVFSGCLQGRHAREPGPKGCVRVDVDDHGQIHVQRVILDVLRWLILDVDVTGAKTIDDVSLAVNRKLQDELPGHDGRLTASRIILRGPCPAHSPMARNPELAAAQIRLGATDAFLDKIWVEKIVQQTSPAADALDLEELAQGGSPQAGVLRALKDLADDPDTFASLNLNLGELQGKLASSGVALPDLQNLEIRRELIQDVQALLSPMLAATSRDEDA